MGNKFALVVFSLLAFSLLLFGCLNQGSQGSRASQSGGQVQAGGQEQASGQLPPDDVSPAAQDASGLELNESDYNSTQ